MRETQRDRDNRNEDSERDRFKGTEDKGPERNRVKTARGTLSVLGIVYVSFCSSCELQFKELFISFL